MRQCILLPCVCGRASLDRQGEPSDAPLSRRQQRIELLLALVDLGQHYARSELHILTHSALSRDQKIEILRRWTYEQLLKECSAIPIIGTRLIA
jgi:hypothetical protein